MFPTISLRFDSCLLIARHITSGNNVVDLVDVYVGMSACQDMNGTIGVLHWCNPTELAVVVRIWSVEFVVWVWFYEKFMFWRRYFKLANLTVSGWSAALPWNKWRSCHSS